MNIIITVKTKDGTALLTPLRTERDALAAQLLDNDFLVMDKLLPPAIDKAVIGSTDAFETEYCDKTCEFCGQDLPRHRGHFRAVADAHWRSANHKRFYDLCVQIRALEHQQALR